MGWWGGCLCQIGGGCGLYCVRSLPPSPLVGCFLLRVATGRAAVGRSCGGHRAACRRPPSRGSGGGRDAARCRKRPSVASPLPLRSLSARHGGGGAMARPSISAAHWKTFFKKNPSGCSGRHFSACIRFTMAAKRW